MSGARLTVCALAWLAGLTPLALPAARVQGTSRFALATLVWAVALSIPFVSRRPRPAASAAGSLALAAPSLALAWVLDRCALDVARRAAEPAEVVFALALVLALAFAAELAARGAARTYAFAWWALVAGAPLLDATLALGGDGRPPVWLGTVAAASPLAWLARPSPPLAWGPAVVALLALVAGLLGRAPEARDARHGPHTGAAA